MESAAIGIGQNGSGITRLKEMGGLMTEENIIHETELNVSGKNYSVQVFSGASGKYYSQTRLGESDVIIIDGISVEDVLERHRFSLPIAIDCRIQWPSLAVISYPTKIS